MDEAVASEGERRPGEQHADAAQHQVCLGPHGRVAHMPAAWTGAEGGGSAKRSVWRLRTLGPPPKRPLELVRQAPDHRVAARFHSSIYQRTSSWRQLICRRW